MASHEPNICYESKRSIEILQVCFSRKQLEQVFLFICVIRLLVTNHLPHSQKWLPHADIEFFLLCFKKITQMIVYRFNWMLFEIGK